MTLKVYTSQYRYSGSDRLDITVKSGDKTFSPTWNMVMGHKNHSLPDESYIKRYTQLMRNSYKKNKDKWHNLLNRDRVTLVCFCRKGSFCHRLLLAKILVKLGADYCGEI
jgi:uncharacterized protein YeaO (DUF488 family)